MHLKLQEAVLYFFYSTILFYKLGHHPIIKKEIIMERLCLDCGALIRGRADKKYCDDSCRNNYNNRLKIEDNLVIKRVNSILRKNRAILAALNPNGKTKVTGKKLISAGFNFEYHTYSYETQNSNTYIFCYEYGYLILGDDSYLLVKREEKLWLA